jgi:DNA-binding CsgD family transcriptional regulator
MSDRADPGPVREAEAAVATATAELASGRACFHRRAWAEAREALARADQMSPLAADDVELLAVASHQLGRDDQYLDQLDRAHRLHVEAGRIARAARCAFWIGFRLAIRGEAARAGGWFARAQRLLEREPPDCAERGYLALQAVEQKLRGGQSEEAEEAYVTAMEVAGIGERTADADLVAIARHQQGRARLQQGRLEDGLALLDETMLAVIGGELSPIVTGLLYCSIIDCCEEVHALGRAREWTAALGAWCDAQPDMASITGICRVHRATIMQRSGAWSQAIEEARRAHGRAPGTSRGTLAEAFYRRGELHRLRGEYDEAEAAYREASQLGREPQPGMALLWLGQDRADAAAAASRRLLSATANRWQRAGLLPAHVEIMLAAGHVAEARSGARELDELAASLHSEVVDAMAAHTRAAVDLAEGDARGALASLKRAVPVWHAIGAPYEAARARVLIGRACQALGDEDGGRLELDAARAELERLGAAPDLARIDEVTRRPARPRGLTPRELEVLRLVAAGKTNRAIAAQLRLSEKTVDRHVSNILVKLDVPSRTAATAFAYQHKLV